MQKIIKRHPNFDKHYKQRIIPHQSLDKRFRTRMQMFTNNPKNPLLRDHALIGTKKGLRSFAITGDIRVIYKEDSSDEITLLDIGAHNQVY